ncbi:MAG TPA: TonB-dependent receptor, partial [Chitinophagales bacterium]|nr:TonB-dependent receptor [Chitinophagales bacterium]
HLFLSGYFGNDKFSSLEETGNYSYGASLKWGNITAVSRWNHQFSPRLFGNLTAHYSRYKFGVGVEDRTSYFGGVNTFTLTYTSGIEDVALRYDFDYRPHPNHNFRAGIAGVHHTYKPGAQQTKQTGSAEIDTTLGVDPIGAVEYDAYLEDDMRISNKLKANLGVHVTAFAVRDEFFTSVQPRAALRYLASDDWSVKASYAQMNQFIHLLTNSSVGLPTDLWVPATDNVPPMISHQGALGVAYTHRKGYEVTVEGYYKTMENVIEYKEGSSFLNASSSWEEKVATGDGRSYGGEFFLQKKEDRLTGMLGYTLSWTNRKFDELNNGERFPYRYDRRHDFKVAGVYALSENIELSAEWIYGTGIAITLPEAVYNGPDGGLVTVYGERNAYRMPAYHRGDVSAKFSKQMRRHQRAWVFSIYNVYNRKNAFFIYQDTSNFQAKFKQVSLFPLIPSVSYQFKF